ncbi:hypothetical protein A0H76_2677 [Hepatospora eriocheir]|uniref:Uncharacterized protein n=1 Tax=Hepatospora eriocheir TaxID=1081669 RepID=A0A1X0QJI0_9MICR|nr:hypothetical protein A0H76_2677 [Hepatospora eriocheir]
MDLVKKAFNNTELIEIVNKNLLFQNEIVETIPISIEVLNNKKYNLNSILLFIKYHNLEHLDYVNICSDLNIRPISLIDKETVYEYIKNYIPPRSQGSFIYPIYTFNDDFSI